MYSCGRKVDRQSTSVLHGFVQPRLTIQYQCFTDSGCVVWHQLPCMYLNNITCPDCTHRHHPDMSLASSWHHPTTTPASSWHPTNCKWAHGLPDCWGCPESWTTGSWCGVLWIPCASIPSGLSPPSVPMLVLFARGGTIHICQVCLWWEGCDKRPCTLIRRLFSGWSHLQCFHYFLSSLCSAQAAPGEVARRHIRPCARYTCINSIRKSSGQTFQALLLTLP